MTRVLAIFAHRPDKVTRVLPYSELEYTFIAKHGPWAGVPPIVQFPVFALSTVWTAVSARISNRAKCLISQFQPDIVFTHGGMSAYRECVATKAAGKKLVMRLGGHPYDELRENMETRGSGRVVSVLGYRIHYWFLFNNLKAADHIVVVSQEMKNRLCTESGRRPETVSVVPVSVAVERYDRPKLNRKTILCVINLNFPSKLRAMRDFLPALRELPNLKVVAPGRLHSKLNIDGIAVHDFIENIEEEYQKAAVLCYFSYLDGCPNVILEAWASHTPVVANRCGWSKELIQDGKTGLLVDDPGETTEKVRMLLSSPTMANGLAEEGYRYVVSHHTERIVGEALGRVLRSVHCGS